MGQINNKKINLTSRSYLNYSLASSIGLNFFIYFLVLLVQYLGFHDTLDLPGSSIYLKAPYALLIIGIVIQATNLTSRIKFFSSLAYLAIPIFLIWLLNLNTDILIFGNADKVSIYKISLKTYLIPILILLIFFVFKKITIPRLVLEFNPTIIKIVLMLITIVPALYVSSFLIIDERHPYMLNSINFMIVIHSIVQSVFGKYVFFDQVSQYGGYAILLRPIWELVDFSILNLTIVFALLNLCVMLILGYLTFKLVNSKLVGVISYLGFIYFHYFAFTVWPFEKYFQYDPVRTIFPAIALLLFYCTKKIRIKVFMMSIVSSTSVIWNIETGLCILLAFVLWMIVALKLREAIEHIVIFMFIFFISIATVISFVSLFTPETFKLEFVYRMLNLYGVTGSMNDLAFGKPWVLVMLVYGISAALAFSVKEQLKKEADLQYNIYKTREDTIIFTSILASCLISYHLLRLGQHDATLGNSGYLFPLLSAYIVDILKTHQAFDLKLKNIRFLYFNFLRVSLVTLLTFLLIISSVSFFLIQRGNVVSNEERIWNFAKPSNTQLYEHVDRAGENYWVTVADQLRGEKSPYEMRMEFVRKFKKEGIQEDLLILSPFDSMMYFHIYAKSPTSWANWWHAWVEDFPEIKKKLESKRVKRILVERYAGINSEPFTFHPYEFDRYMDQKLKTDFEIIESQEITKIWLGKEWSSVTLTMYQLR